VLLERVARTSAEIAQTSARKKKVVLLAQLLGEAPAEERAIAARYLSGELGHKTGIGYATIAELRGVPPAATSTLSLVECDRRFARRLILDAEAIAYRPDGRPLPFQDTMRRKSASAASAGNGSAHLSLSAFDLLLADDQTLLGAPARDRFTALASLAPSLAVPRLVTGSADEATAFYERAIAGGHEGVMAKALDAPYDAGNRGASWLKIKKVRHLDLVVLAAEWGSGRRRGWLSNIHIGARSPTDPTHFTMLGKTFKGMTDEMLAWQTSSFLAREVDRDGHIVYIHPEIVVEIAFNDVQRSSQYEGGLALRHARVVRYREDKTVAESDTIDAVRAIAIADGVIG
jgi:DNA ligase-1